MSESLWIGVAPGSEATRVIGLSQGKTFLKGHLAAAPQHPRALSWLLEAIALWQGAKVRCVLCAEGGVGTRVPTFYHDWFADFGGPLYALEWGEHLREVTRRADRLEMSGDFRRLHQLHLADLLHREGA